MRFPIAFLTLLATASLALPQDAKIPSDLRHVPPDALGFIHFRAGDFLKNDLGKQILLELMQDKEAVRGLQKIEQELGLKLTDIDNVTVLMLGLSDLAQMRYGNGPGRRDFMEREFEMRRRFEMEREDMRRFRELEKMEMLQKRIFEEKQFEDKKPEAKPPEAKVLPVLFQEEHRHDHGMPEAIKLLPYLDPYESMDHLATSGPLVIVTTTKDLDRKKILKTKLFSEKPRGPRYDFRDRPDQQRSVLILGDRTLMLGAPWELARYSEQMARNPGPKSRPMEAAFALAAKPHVLVAGGHLPAEVRRMIFMPFNVDLAGMAAISPLLVTETALAIDLGKHLDLTLAFHAPTEASAGNALQAAKTLRVLADLAIEKTSEAGEPGGWKLTLEKRLKQAVNDTVIEQKGNVVRIQTRMELDPVLVRQFTKEFAVKAASVRSRADRTQSINNLKQIGLAMHSFHDTYKRLPAAGVGGPMPNVIAPDGKPLLSWRVAILPYIDQQPLYQQFDLSQPWDHPTNKKLIPLMPHIYMLPGAPESKEPGMTHYRVLVGPQTMFEPQQRITMVGVSDGTSNTIMAVEAKEPTIWTRPDDLPFDPKGPLPKFGVSADGFLALFGDGTVRQIRATTPEEHLRALITRNGGESVPIPD